MSLPPLPVVQIGRRFPSLCQSTTDFPKPHLAWSAAGQSPFICLRPHLYLSQPSSRATGSGWRRAQSLSPDGTRRSSVVGRGSKPGAQSPGRITPLLLGPCPPTARISQSASMSGCIHVSSSSMKKLCPTAVCPCMCVSLSPQHSHGTGLGWNLLRAAWYVADFSTHPISILLEHVLRCVSTVASPKNKIRMYLSAKQSQINYHKNPVIFLCWLRPRRR